MYTHTHTHRKTHAIRFYSFTTLHRLTNPRWLWPRHRRWKSMKKKTNQQRRSSRKTKMNKLVIPPAPTAQRQRRTADRIPFPFLRCYSTRRKKEMRQELPTPLQEWKKRRPMMKRPLPRQPRRQLPHQLRTPRPGSQKGMHRSLESA